MCGLTFDGSSCDWKPRNRLALRLCNDAEASRMWAFSFADGEALLKMRSEFDDRLKAIGA